MRDRARWWQAFKATLAGSWWLAAPGVVVALMGLPLRVQGAAAELPPGWRTETVESCDRQPLALVAPDPGAQRDLFSVFKLALTADAKVSGQSLHWRFVPRQRDLAAELHFPRPPVPPDAFSVWVKNPHRHDLSLALRVVNEQGFAWQTPGIPLLDKANWTHHLWRLDQLREGAGKVSKSEAPAGEANSWQVVVSGGQAGDSYELYIDELQVHYAPPVQLRVTEVQMPDSSTAGEVLPGAIKLQITGQVTQAVELQIWLARGGQPATVATVTVPPGAVAESWVELELALPRHLRGGKYEVTASTRQPDLATVTMATKGEVAVQGGEVEVKPEVMAAGQGGGLSAFGRRLPVVGGLLVEGETLPEGWQWVMVPLALATGWGTEAGWQAVDERLAAVAAANPQAVLIPVIDVSAPPQWLAQHPDEVMVTGEGSKVLAPSGAKGGRSHESWASVNWRKAAAAELIRLLEHLEQGPLGGAIIGYQIAAGEGGAWVYPGTSPGLYTDYSGPQQWAFREWLKGRYGSLQALRVAWGQPAKPVGTPESQRESPAILSWEQAKIPSQALRKRGSCGVLHEPSMSQEVVDYQIFAADLVVETIIELAKAVRQATGQGKLVGVAYGLLLDLAETPAGIPHGGHLALAPLSQAAEIDFVVTPYREVKPDEPPLLRTVYSSLASHGKLWVATAPTAAGAAAWAVPLGSGGVVAVAGGRADEAGQLATEPLSGRRGSVSEVAVVLDDMSAAYSAAGTALNQPLLHEQRFELSQLGAPCDLWLMDDVLAGRAANYRLYIFLNAFYMDAATRHQLQQVLQSQPCTAVWVYAAGGIDSTISGRGLKDLTGVTAAMKMDESPLQVRVSGRVGTFTYGASKPLWPRFIGLDSPGEVLGVIADTPYGGLISQQWGELRSIWSAAPRLPVALLREIAREAGVHLYTEVPAGVYACEGLMVVYYPGGGEIKVQLPLEAEVSEAKSGRSVGDRVKELKVKPETSNTSVYQWEMAGGR